MNYLAQNVRRAEVEKPRLQVGPAWVEELCHLKALSLGVGHLMSPKPGFQAHTVREAQAACERIQRDADE